MENLLKDIRYGFRVLLKKPGFTFVAVLALALGIGANTAIFSVVNGVLLRPLPYPESENLVRVYEKRLQLGRTRNVASSPDFIDWRAQNQVFEQMAAWTGWGANLTDGGEPERIQGAAVTWDLFPLLRVKPLLGRTFLSEEGRPNNNLFVIISHGFWQRRYGGSPDIVGQTITLNGAGVTVIGVMPPDFQFPNKDTEIWVPMWFDPADPGNRGGHFLGVIARLKPGVSLGQAQVEMDSIAARLEQQYPVNTGHGVNLFPLYEETVGDIRPALLVLLGAVGFVLLIACANVANLLLVRSAGRQREIAIRTAMGASRFRIIKQLLTESLLLSLVGGALGLLLAFWGVDLLLALSPEDMPRITEIRIDGRVLGFTFALSLFTGVVFGLLPALSASRLDLNTSLKEGGRSSALSFGRNRARGLLVVSEVALAVVLLIGAGLMMKSFLHLQTVGAGFNPQSVLAVDFVLPASKYREGEQQAAFFRQVIERVSALPGIQSVGGVVNIPFGENSGSRYFRIEGRPPQPEGQGLNADYNLASPNYFRTLGIPLIKGRDFTERDVQGAPEVVMINEEMARQFWPDEDPIGKRIAVGDGPWRSIVGIVGNVRQKGFDIEPRQEMIFPLLQTPIPFMTLVARTASEPKATISALRAEIASIDALQPVFNIRTMEEAAAESVAPERLNTLLLGALAVIALILAAVGIYGVMSYSVTQRTHEIGLRMALGALPRSVLGLVIKQGMSLILIGLVIGLSAALALTRLMKSLLYEVSTTDPATFALISALLVVVAFLATYIPARRATRVDPGVALRYE